MLKDVVDVTNKMIETLYQENDILVKGRYAEARTFAKKKDKVANTYKELLNNLKDQSHFLTALTPAQKKLLRERFSLCKNLSLENKKLLQYALNANDLFLNSFMKHLNIDQAKLLLYKSNGGASDKDKVRAMAISIDDQY